MVKRKASRKKRIRKERRTSKKNNRMKGNPMSIFTRQEFPSKLSRGEESRQ